MKLSDLIVDTLFLCNTTSGQYSEDDIKRNLNFYYDEAVLEIWKNEAMWKFDENGDYLPIAWANIKKDTNDYQIPTDARKIEKAEILVNNMWKQLHAVNLQDIRSESKEQTGTPNRYYINGRSVYLYPTPREDIEEGLRLYVSKSVTALDDSNDEPKIDREFHRYLSTGATMDWYFTRGNINKSREMERKLLAYKEEIRNFYTSRNEDKRSTLKVKLENYK